MTKLSLVATAVLTCLIAGSTVAADMPVKAYPGHNYQTYSWSGFYVGGVVGAGIVTSQFSDHDTFFVNGNWQAGGWSDRGPKSGCTEQG
jgi:hypothetical protein